MTKKLNKIIFLAPALLLTSCGYGLKQIYDGNLYNSPIWENNYYRHFDENTKNSDYTEEYIDDSDLPFTSIQDDNFKILEPGVTEGQINDESSNGFGPKNALSNVDESFKYGYTSKLFDGRMHCYGRYETVRVQIDESGMGTLFSKEMVKGEYFLMQFKSSLDFKEGTKIEGHQDDITLKIGFVLRTDNGYATNYLLYNLPKVNTNRGEKYDYVTFGFSLNNINTNRLCGVTIEYKLNHETFNEKEGTNLAHALFLYEIMFPKSTWR